MSSLAYFTASIAFIDYSGTSVSNSPPKISIEAYSGGELLVDGFEYPVVIDFEGLSLRETVPLNVDHNTSLDYLIGQGSPVYADGRLTIPGTITGDNEPTKKVLRLNAAGFKWQASIGAIVDESTLIQAGQKVVINGRMFVGPIVHATKSRLTHCAVLSEGADQTSAVTIAAKLAAKGNRMSFEEWVASLGLDPATLQPAAVEFLQSVYPGATPMVDAAAVTPPEQKPAAVAATAAPVPTSVTASLAASLQAVRDADAAEVVRKYKINAACAKHPLVAAKAIKEGWSPEKAELEALKLDRSSVASASFNTVDMQADGPQILEAALCVARKIPGHEKQFSDKVLQAAHTHYRRVGLQQVILASAIQNGYHHSEGGRIHNGNLRDVLSFAMERATPRELRASAFSTVSLPGIFGNVANKELLAGYMEEDQSWREVMAIKSVSDFKTVTSYRMLDDMEYEALTPAGEIKHGKISEESYTRSVDTFAKMFTLSRKSIINDDLSAFDDLRNRVGRGAAKKLNRLAWTEWLDNSTFFTAARGNYITGSTTTLLTDGVGLGLALDAFDALRTPSADGSKVPGGLVGGSPTILLTPGGGISRAAEVLYTNSNLGNGTANADANIHSGRYKPVKSVFLNDSSISGYSTTAWYLLRDPSAGAAVVVSFLDGVETPTVESAEADFNTLGIQFRGYHDFGVDKAEYLAGVKSKGAA